jgi:LysM repeat protein
MPALGESSRKREPPSPSSSPRNTIGQLHFFQALAGLLALVIVAGAGYMVYRQHQVQPVQILVDRQPVATVENLADARALLRSVQDQDAGTAYISSGDPLFKQTVQLVRVPASTPLDSDDTAKNKLASALRVTVLADLITIDGKPFVALPDKETAQATLDSVRNHYADMPPNDPLVEKPSFQEHVEIDRERVSSSLIKQTPGQAAPLLWTPPQAKTYAVQLHETGWSIARKFHMAFADFLRANSGRDINHLAPGDTVAVSQTYPALTVIVKKRSQEQEQIIPGAPADVGGLRQITLVTTYINGIAEGPGQAINIYTLQRARPRSVVE